MKLLILIAASATIVAGLHFDSERSYKSENDYLYEYNVQTLSGFTGTNQFSGLKIKTDARLQFQRSSKVILQLENVELFKVHSELDNFSPDEQIPESSLEKDLSEEAIEMITHLEKPFRFTYESGVVRELEVARDEPHWSVNMKKGLLTTLKVNLGAENRIADLSVEWMDKIWKNEASFNPMETPLHFMSVMEDDATGICEDILAIEHLVNNEQGTPQMKVIKVRNYENCQKLPSWTTAFSTVLRAENTTTNEETTAGISHSTYHVNGDIRNFIIIDGQVYTKMTVGQSNYENNMAITHLTQTLNLKSVEQNEEQIQVSHQLESKPDLVMEIPDWLTTPQTTVTLDSSLVTKHVNIAKNLLEELSQLISSEDIEEQTTTKLAELSETIQPLPLEDIKQLLNEFKNPTNTLAQRKTDFLFSCLTTLDRPDLVFLVKELLNEEIISQQRAFVLVNVVSALAEPSADHVTKLIELYLDSSMQPYQTLRKTLILSAGSMGYRVVTEYRNRLVPTTTTIPQKHRMAEAFRRVLDQVRSDEEKILVLKAIGNMGLEDLMPEIEKIITNHNAEPELRAKAIYALRRFPHQLKRKVQSICLPIYLDPREPVPVRIAAFTQIMNNKPSTGLIQLLIHTLKEESSLPVSGYVWSYFKGIQESGEGPIAETVRITLPALENYAPTTKYAKVFRYETETKRNMGMTGLLSIINKARNVIPDTIVGSLNGRLNNEIFNLFEFGVEGYGIETIMDVLYEEESLFTSLLSGQDISSSLSHLVNKLKPFIYEDSVKTSIYFKLLGNEMHTFNTELRELKEYWTELVELVPTWISKMNKENTVEKTFANHMKLTSKTYATPAGIPISINSTMTTIFNLNGKIEMQGLTSQIIDFLLGRTPAAKALLDITPKFLSNINMKIGTHFGFFRTSSVNNYNAKSVVPLKLEVTVDPAQHKISVTKAVTTQITKILSLWTEPLTTWSKTLLTPTGQTIMKREEKPVPMPISEPFNEETFTFLEETLGMPLKIQTKMCKPFMPALCPEEVTLHFEKTSYSPEHLEFTFNWDMNTNDWFLFPTESEAQWNQRAQSSDPWYSTEDRQSRPIISDSNPTPAFTKVEVSTVFSDPKPTGRFVFTARSLGGSVKFFTKAQIAHVMDNLSWNKHQFNVQMISSGLKPSLKNNVKVEFNTVVALPECLTKDVPTPEHFKLLETTMSYGTPDYTVKTGQFKVFFGREEYTTLIHSNENEQSNYKNIGDWFVNKVSNWNNKNKETVQYRQQMQHGSTIPYLSSFLNTGVQETPYIDATPMYFTFEYGYDFTKVPTSIKENVWTLYNVLLTMTKISTTMKVTRTETDVSTPNKVIVTTTLLPKTGSMMVTVVLPTETDVITGFPLPFAHNFLQNRHEMTKPHQEFLHDITGHMFAPAVCVADTKSVMTYDMHRIEMPNQPCEVILTKDCHGVSDVEVTIRKEASKETKVLNVRLAEVDIEIRPTVSGWISSTERLECFVNGVEKTLNEPLEIKYTTGDRKHIIITHTENGIVIERPSYGLTVFTDGRHVQIKASSWLRSRLCGLCGDNNGDALNDMIGPQGAIHRSDESVYAAWTVQSADCDAETLRQQFTNVYTDECRKVERTIIVERHMDGEKKTCFSVRPVSVCSGHCRKQQPNQHKIGFHCLPASEKSTQQLVNESHNVPITGLKNKAVHFSESVYSHEYCLPIYN